MTSPSSASAAKDLDNTSAGRPHAAAGSRYHGYVSLQARGTVSLPPALRKRYGLDTPGTQLELTEREDGVLEVRPMIAVPATEAWFWSSAWQAGEAEVDTHVARGEVTTFDTAEGFLADLETLNDVSTSVSSSDRTAADATADGARDVDAAKDDCG